MTCLDIGCSRGCGRQFAEEDFSDEYFKNNWTIVCDKYGNGCCIDFPLVMTPRLDNGPIVYETDVWTDNLLEETMLAK